MNVEAVSRSRLDQALAMYRDNPKWLVHLADLCNEMNVKYRDKPSGDVAVELSPIQLSLVLNGINHLLFTVMDGLE